MFVDVVLPHLVVFAFGQAAAWLYLRTGRVWLGAATTIVLWLLIDWWLVGRFVFGAGPADQRLPLLSMQLVSLAAVAGYVAARVRRRVAAPKRQQRFAAALQLLLSDRVEQAATAFRALVRSDPWDAAAWIALGDARRRAGEPGRARRCYRRARGVDTGGTYRDLLQHRIAPPGMPAARTPAPGVVPGLPSPAERPEPAAHKARIVGS